MVLDCLSFFERCVDKMLKKVLNVSTDEELMEKMITLLEEMND